MTIDFVSSYVSECIKKGSCKPEEICKNALDEIRICQNKIAEIDNLRIRKDNLTQVLRYFNHDSIRSLKGNKVDTSERPDESSVQFQEFSIKICSYVENSVGPVSVSSIVESVGGYEFHALIYGAIKKLCSDEVLDRNDDRKIIQGVKWQQRPLSIIPR
jgi:hypothetical protein